MVKNNFQKGNEIHYFSSTWVFVLYSSYSEPHIHVICIIGTWCCKHNYAHSNMIVRTRAGTHTQGHTYRDIHTGTHSHTHARTHALTHSRTHAHTRTHTHTHTIAFSVLLRKVAYWWTTKCSQVWIPLATISKIGHFRSLHWRLS